MAILHDPVSIAVEHVRYMQAQGFTYYEILEAVGALPSASPSFDETVAKLAAGYPAVSPLRILKTKASPSRSRQGSADDHVVQGQARCAV